MSFSSFMASVMLLILYLLCDAQNAEGSSDYAPVDSREEAASSIIAPSPRTQRKERLKSLDTFRGWVSTESLDLIAACLQ